jgi:hypothetical protein
MPSYIGYFKYLRCTDKKCNYICAYFIQYLTDFIPKYFRFSFLWKHAWILMTYICIFLGVLPTRKVYIWTRCALAVSDNFSNCGTPCFLLCICGTAFDE